MCMFDNSNGHAIFATAVNDMPILYKSDAMKQFLITGISGKYKITIKDPTNTILGLEIERDRANRTIKLRQRGSMHDLLNEWLPTWDKVDVSTLEMIPMQPAGPLSKEDTKLNLIYCDSRAITDFASQCGALNWLSHTSADFIHATRVLSSKMSKPTEMDRKRMRHFISCLARIRRLDLDGLILGGRDGMQLLSKVDSSHGMDGLKGRTGGTLHMSPHTGSIMSLCEKQSITTDSAMACEGVGAHLQVRRVIPIIFSL